MRIERAPSGQTDPCQTCMLVALAKADLAVLPERAYVFALCGCRWEGFEVQISYLLDCESARQTDTICLRRVGPRNT